MTTNTSCLEIVKPGTAYKSISIDNGADLAILRSIDGESGRYFNENQEDY